MCTEKYVIHTSTSIRKCIIYADMFKWYNFISLIAVTEVPCTLECHEQFYCDNNFCKPRCDRFREFSSSYVTATDAVIVFSAVVCVVTGIFVLVFTCLRYKRMYV